MQPTDIPPQDQPPERAPVPKLARIAGWLWILATLLVLGGLGAMLYARPPGGKPAWALLFVFPRPLLLIFGAIIAARFLWAGVWTVRGWATDLQGYARDSAVFAAGFAYVAFLLWRMDALAACLPTAVAATLFAAWMLAGLGGRLYLEWKEDGGMRP